MHPFIFAFLLIAPTSLTLGRSYLYLALLSLIKKDFLHKSNGPMIFYSMGKKLQESYAKRCFLQIGSVLCSASALTLICPKNFSIPSINRPPHLPNSAGRHGL